MNDVSVEEKTILDIFNGNEHYTVPIYQREYAWTEYEVGRLLADIWESFQKDNQRNYYLGTLVVVRKGTGWEVVDGQQRLTTLSLLYPRICNGAATPVVDFENRQVATDAIVNLYSVRCDIEKLPTDKAKSLPQSMASAVRRIEGFSPATVDGNLTTRTFLEMLDADPERGSLREYILNKVKLFRVAMNKDTVDPMSYFEVMNNRGEQLKYHELLKAKMLDALNEMSVCQVCGGRPYSELAEIFDRIWTACSYMDGNLLDHMHACFDLTIPGAHWWSLEIDDVRRVRSEDEKSPPWERQSVIRDFPNFLMHVLRLYVRNYGQEGMDEKSVPLDERPMQQRFEDAPVKVDPVLFLDLLVKTRLDYDRFVVKAKMINDEVEGWRLKSVVRYLVKGREQNKYDAVNTYGHVSANIQSRVVCLQSALQVSNAEQRYKEWVYAILSASDAERNDPLKMISILEDYARKRIMAAKESLEKDGDNLFACGLRTPRLFLNFIDYLMWRKSPCEFVFKYYNSIEHHHPQHDDKERDRWLKEQIDEIGNLYLTSASDNSSMNNNPSIGKVAQYKSHNNRLPDYPKRGFMYMTTEESDGWTFKKMHAHTEAIINLMREFGINDDAVSV